MHRLLVAFMAPAFALAIGCHRGPSRIANWSPRFGPVVGNDTIVGRAYADGRVVLLTDGPALIRIDLTRQIVEPRPVSGRGIDILWGLAQLEDGSLWTLAGQRALGKIEADGRISERIQLLAPHVGLFSTGRELVYQELNFLPPADALAAGPPGERSRHRWSGLQTRRYALARASVAALNLISCGASDSAEIPCWFPDEAAVTLVRQDGESRRVALPGLPVVAPEVLLTSENPARPVRDVFVAASRDLWILSTGVPGPTQGPVVPGGWLLARYDDGGRLLGRTPTPAGVRLILYASGDRCVVLAADGRVIEVRL